MSMTIPELAEQEGITATTLYNWRKQARARGQVLPSRSTQPDQWTSQEKFQIVLETAPMNEAELSAYCRERGLYPEQVEAWRDACMNANEDAAAQAKKSAAPPNRTTFSDVDKTAEAALEEALVHRFGALGRIHQPLALRSDNGLVFSSRHYTATVKAYGLTQEFTTPYTPEQNGLVERFFRSLKEECIWQHRFESLGQARAVIGRWIRYYNEERPHQSLGYVAPRAHPALAA